MPAPWLRTVAPLAVGAWLLARVEPPRATAPEGPPRATAPGCPPRATAPVEPGPTLAVFVPARNEEAALPLLLRSLAAQTRRPDHLVVIDDGSLDATAEVAAAAGATVLTPPPLPDGWVGKTWALHHGAGTVDADLLVFLDADVVLAPEALAALEAEHRRRGGLVSVQPQHRTQRWHEQLSAVANVVSMMGTGAFSGPPRRPVAMAFGPCLAIGRADYDAIGGHADPSVRRQVAEDIAMARLMAELGRPVHLFGGGGLVGFRMYPDGPRQLIEGWTKMLGNGGRRTDPLVGVAVSIWLTGALRAAGAGMAGTTRLLQRRGRRGDVAAVLAYGAWAAEMGWLFGRVGRWKRTTALAFPVPLAAFVALFARSALLLALGRPATWRGRRVPAG